MFSALGSGHDPLIIASAKFCLVKIKQFSKLLVQISQSLIMFSLLLVSKHNHHHGQTSSQYETKNVRSCGTCGRLALPFPFVCLSSVVLEYFSAELPTTQNLCFN